MDSLFEFDITGLTGGHSPERRMPRGHNFTPHGPGGSGGDPPGGSPGGGEPPAETQQERIQRLIQEFQTSGIDPAVAGLGQDRGFLLGLRNQFGNIASGNDPRFAAFREGQFGLLNQQRGTQLAQRNAGLARSGVNPAGSVGANALAGINRDFDIRQSALSGQVGLAEMRREDDFLRGQAGLTGQISENRVGTAGLQGLPAGLDIAALAAQNAGEGGEGGGLTVICTALNAKGDVPNAAVLAGTRLRQRMGDRMYRGYLTWAGPLVNWSRKSPGRYRIFRALFRRAALQMLYEETGRGISTRPGWVMLRIATGLSWVMSLQPALFDLPESEGRHGT